MTRNLELTNKPKPKHYRILGVFAHPDDESFGPGGTLAKYAAQGHQVSVITMTKGQAGQTSDAQITKELGYHRELEVLEAARILGFTELKLMDFYDGSLNQHQLPLLKRMIEAEIDRLNPEVIIVFERAGISWHLDHIAVTKAVIELFDEDRIHPQKIYYFGFNVEYAKAFGMEGGMNEDNLTCIDIESSWKTKVSAMKAHKSQERDWQRLLDRFTKLNKEFGCYESFKLARTRLEKYSLPEKDLLAGLV